MNDFDPVPTWEAGVLRHHQVGQIGLEDKTVTLTTKQWIIIDHDLS
jgi:hypothetical protein